MPTPINRFAEAATRRLAPAKMVNGRYVDNVTGRPAYYGPQGQPGTIKPEGAYTQSYTMPDGRVAYYDPNSFGYKDPSRPAQAAPPGAQQTGATALPYQPEAGDAMLQLLQQKNRFESDMVSEQERINRGYMTSTRDLQEQVPDAQRNLLENYAGRGMAYSSGYAHDQTKQQGQFANMFSELDQNKTQALSEILRQRGLFNDQYALTLQQIQAAAARRLAEQAGTLGLGY